jgi:glyoxylase-like metal-dependent hydrolase (beta-lactamase superfamily II)
MTAQIDRIEGLVMRVNAFLVHGPDGVVLVDGILTVSDSALVRQAIDDTGHPSAGEVVTHPHPDHYAGLAHLVGTDDVAIVATNAVDAIIRIEPTPATLRQGGSAHQGQTGTSTRPPATETPSPKTPPPMSSIPDHRLTG